MQRRVGRFIILVIAVSTLGCGGPEEGRDIAAGAETDRQTRFSVWYWLNAVPRTQWKQDFTTIAEHGFDDVIVCWGYDLSAFRLRKQDSLEALELCRQAGLGAYLLIWHPTHNSLLLEADPTHLQVDNLGQRRFSFNLFSREWRETQWRDYLHDICSTYRDAPALVGYVLDDSFAVGPVSRFGGEPGVQGGPFVSYSEADQTAFREWLRARYSNLGALNERWGRSYSDWSQIEAPVRIEEEPVWQDWTEARTEWLEDWSKATMRFIRETDSDPEHIVYIEDLASVLGTESQESEFSYRPITVVDVAGLRFGRVTRHFDRLGAYTVTPWNSEDALPRAMQTTNDVIDETIRQAGGVDQLVYTFWISAIDQVFQPGPVTHPTGEEIWRLTQLAREKGVRYIDYYAFDVGNADVRGEEEWKAYLPGSGPDYPLAKQYREKWLTDRPGSVLKELGKFLTGLASQPPE